MRFDVADEERTFAESVRSALGGWEAPREPELGAWQDDGDAALEARLEAVGFAELWKGGDLIGATVAGAHELGRAVAPIGVVDAATLGAPLWVGGRARHGLRAEFFAAPRPGGGLALVRRSSDPLRETTLDGNGTVRVEVDAGPSLDGDDARARWQAWSAATLSYVAGLGERALELAVEHARTREQFGAPLAALPAVQSRLADAALVVDATRLLAWLPADGESPRASALAWAGAACCEATASAIQVHGAVGFALESGLHCAFRRARAVHLWALAACAAAR